MANSKNNTKKVNSKSTSSKKSTTNKKSTVSSKSTTNKKKSSTNKKSTTNRSNTSSKTNNKLNRDRVIKKIESDEDIKDSLASKIIVVCSVIIVLSLFYLLALHITNKNAGNTDTSSDTGDSSSDYSEILLGSSFNRSEKEYLVIYYDRENEDVSSTLSTSITDYSTKDKALTVYTVDMSNMFNKDYNTSDEVNTNPSEVSELKINGPTLIRFVDGKVEEYITGTDDIKDYLGQ